MRVVIVGARLRSESEDFTLVNSLIDELKKMYPGLFIVTTACDRGVGKIVKNRLIPVDPNKPPIIPFLEVAYRIWGEDMPKAVYANIYLTRNPALLALGEEFHIFVDKDKRGVMQDLLERVQDAGLPYSVYQPNEITGPKLLK